MILLGDSMDKAQLVLSREIEICGMGVLHIPTVREITKIGQKKADLLLLPYLASTEYFPLKDGDKSLFRNFDTLFFTDRNGEKLLKTEENQSYFSFLQESLEFYFKDTILISEKDMIVAIGSKGTLYRENFDELSEMILELNFTKRPKVEKAQTFKNERQKDIYNKMMAGRRRKREKETPTMYEMINVVRHGGNSTIPYDEINNMTITQFMNDYVVNINRESFSREFQKYLAGCDPKQLDLTYWTEKIKQI